MPAAEERRNLDEADSVLARHAPRPELKPRSVFLAVAVVVAVQACAALLAFWALPDWETRGQFGDMFGAVNAFFSGLALMAVAYALVLQSRELALQRAELAATREEVRQSVKAQQQLATTSVSQLELAQREREEVERRSLERTAPRFGVRSPGSASGDTCNVLLDYSGDPILDARVKSCIPGETVELGQQGLKQPGKPILLRLSNPCSQTTHFVLWYTDSEGRKRSTLYCLDRRNLKVWASAEVSKEQVGSEWAVVFEFTHANFPMPDGDTIYL